MNKRALIRLLSLKPRLAPGSRQVAISKAYSVDVCVCVCISVCVCVKYRLRPESPILLLVFFLSLGHLYLVQKGKHSQVEKQVPFPMIACGGSAAQHSTSRLCLEFSTTRA